MRSMIGKISVVSDRFRPTNVYRIWEMGSDMDMVASSARIAHLHSWAAASLCPWLCSTEKWLVLDTRQNSGLQDIVSCVLLFTKGRLCCIVTDPKQLNCAQDRTSSCLSFLWKSQLFYTVPAFTSKYAKTYNFPSTERYYRALDLSKM